MSKRYYIGENPLTKGPMGIQPFTPQFFKKAQAANPLLAPLTFSTLLCKVRYKDKSSYKYLLGEEEIITWLLKNRNKGRKNSEYEERYQYDAKSLLAICMLRKGFCPAHIEDARAMLVIQDLWLNRCLESLYPDKFSKEVPYAITDAELVSMLWLRDHKNETHIPSELLIICN